MRTSKGIAGLLSLFILSAPAWAQNWVEITMEGGDIYAMDYDSIQAVSDDQITFKTLLINRDEAFLSPDGARFDYIIMSVLGDCRQGVLAIENSVAYDINDNVYGSSAVTEMLPAAHNSPEEAVLFLACDAAGMTGNQFWYQRVTLIKAMAG